MLLTYQSYFFKEGNWDISLFRSINKQDTVRTDINCFLISHKILCKSGCGWHMNKPSGKCKLSEYKNNSFWRRWPLKYIYLCILYDWQLLSASHIFRNVILGYAHEALLSKWSLLMDFGGMEDSVLGFISRYPQKKTTQLLPVAYPLKLLRVAASERRPLVRVSRLQTGS